MTVLKKYNVGTAQWEAIVSGTQGPTGPTGPTGPSTGLFDGVILRSAEERWSVSASGVPSTLDLDVLTSSAWLYTGAAGSNWTLNVRGNSGTTLSSILTTGDSITIALAVWMTSSMYQTAFSIDGTSVTPEWQGGTAPTSGNSSSYNVYVFTIVKTAATPTYVVFGSRTQFT